MTRIRAALASLVLCATLAASAAWGANWFPLGGEQYDDCSAAQSLTISLELLSSSGWTSTGWTGDYASGWTHTTGNTTALSNTLAAIAGEEYRVTYTITTRTAGSIVITFGGEASAAITATGTYDSTASTTGALSIAPTTDFDGTLVLSIKRLTLPDEAVHAVFVIGATNGVCFRFAGGTPTASNSLCFPAGYSFTVTQSRSMLTKVTFIEAATGGDFDVEFFSN